MLGVWDTKEYAAIISNVGCCFFNSSLQILDSDFRIITIRCDWRKSHHFRILISKINEQLDPHYKILDLKKNLNRLYYSFFLWTNNAHKWHIPSLKMLTRAITTDSESVKKMPIVSNRLTENNDIEF